VEEVIRRAQSGDSDALAHLWRTYNHLVVRYLRGHSTPDPDDLASVVWIEVATSIGRFEGSEPDFRRWLFTIAARRRIDAIRSSRRRDDRVQRAYQRDHVPCAPPAEEEAQRAESLDYAIELVRGLPPDQAEAVLLRVVADLSVSEVAAIMGRREGTVRALVHRGLKRLAARPSVTNDRSRTMC